MENAVLTLLHSHLVPLRRVYPDTFGASQYRARSKAHTCSLRPGCFLCYPWWSPIVLDRTPYKGYNGKKTGCNNVSSWALLAYDNRAICLAKIHPIHERWLGNDGTMFAKNGRRSIYCCLFLSFAIFTHVSNYYPLIYPNWWLCTKPHTDYVGICH